MAISEISFKINGLEELKIKLNRINRSITTKMGIAASNGAGIIADSMKSQLVSFDAVDTFGLYNTIGKQQTGPYSWMVGEVIPTENPHGIFVEFGFMQHWIHLDQINPDSGFYQYAILRANRDGFLKVGPMGPRPWFSTGRDLGLPMWKSYMRQTFLLASNSF